MLHLEKRFFQMWIQKPQLAYRNDVSLMEIVTSCASDFDTVAGQQCGPQRYSIWELLTYEEKMGRLMYLFVHLVQRYCKTSPSNDCRKIMTLHGISNLLNYDEHTLDLLDRIRGTLQN
ncbi:uncharacterized protein CEXT_88941 [Caerostris extrusa]|uniref:Uncharacterized protein n=1 Tax=Caerostris extrusa TaxID=172846 RepID=A0AAV4TM23_CAEEX|nr:uncharacterized protein CEXT_88941 [Caerostris extrusa]